MLAVKTGPHVLIAADASNLVACHLCELCGNFVESIEVQTRSPYLGDSRGATNYDREPCLIQQAPPLSSPNSRCTGLPAV